MPGLVYPFFFCSGLSGLIYQIVWVRVFGNLFGNTIHSASVVVAVFMLGLGVGSWVVGTWSDRWYAAAQPKSLVHTYGYFELLIALMGISISLLLPHLSTVSALVSSYSQDDTGWYVLSTMSYLARVGIAVVLLVPITLLMAGTLTLLVRHLVRHDPQSDNWKIAVLYGVNTAGAAVGCVLTDFALVPFVGLRNTQIVAAFLNLAAGLGALLLARGEGPHRLSRDTARRGRNARRDAGHQHGGWSAPRAASGEPRIKAVVMASGSYDLGQDLFDYYPPIQERVRWIIGARDVAEARRKLRRVSA